MVYRLPKGELKNFPPVSEADSDGLLCFEGDLSVSNLKLAYQTGIFPWPQKGLPLLWFSPPMRGILFFDDLHIAPRFTRELKKQNFEFRFNTAFGEVVRACAQAKNRKGQRGTWITPEMMSAYQEMHDVGAALSFETWKDGQLVGGLYGVWLGDFFAGESMFHTVSGASKFALVQAVAWLKAQKLKWMDIQMVTPLLKTFGAKEIPRRDYLKLLKTRN